MNRFFTILTTTLICCSSASAFTIKGKLADSNNESWVKKVYLSRLASTDDFFSANRQFVVDSAIINGEGEFVFSDAAVIVENNFYRLSIVPDGSENTFGAYLNMIGTAENYFIFLLNKNANIKLTSTFKAFNYDMTLDKADATNAAVAKVFQIRKNENELVDVLIKKRMALDKEMPGYKDSVKQLNEALFSSAKTTGTQAALEKYADTVSDVYASILAVTYIMEPDSALMLRLYNRYTEQIPESAYTAKFSERIYGKADAIKIGDNATDFILIDTEGKKISLSDYKGSYVLVDFWASWCTPCRKEFSNTIVPMYEKYKTKGFKVLAVSTDTKEENWRAAIKKSGMTSLTNVVDNKGEQPKVATDYKVESLPTNFLIDPKGKIINMNLRDVKLENALAEIYK